MSESSVTQSHVEPTPSSAPSPWLNVEQAARYIGVGPGLIYRACGSGRLRHSRVGDRKHGLLRFRVEWLDAYMETPPSSATSTHSQITRRCWAASCARSQLRQRNQHRGQRRRDASGQRLLSESLS